MKFSTFLIVVIVAYVLYYGWMIFSDVFLKKDAVPMETVGDEVEVDVGEESADFRPERVRKPGNLPKNQAQTLPESPVNTGAIYLEDFAAMAEDFAENGEYAALGKQLREWGAIVA